ncbi:MAG: hypothetical protein BWY66_02208 [bacterium ADurb.Bin374]|nr:MAG: hypothetical protein BWY66_02208 [bacterium ADurb.Bin374]
MRQDQRADSVRSRPTWLISVRPLPATLTSTRALGSIHSSTRTGPASNAWIFS